MVSIKQSPVLQVNSYLRAQSGRSMTEMLGVLAVISVLSLIGIMGFKLAMTKWRANELVAEVNMRSVTLVQQLVQNPNDIDMEMGGKTKQGYTITSALDADDDNYFYISVEEIPTSVCREVLNLNWDGPAEIYVAEYAGSENPEACGEGDTVPQMDFKFHKQMDVRAD